MFRPKYVERGDGRVVAPSSVTLLASAPLIRFGPFLRLHSIVPDDTRLTRVARSLGPRNWEASFGMSSKHL